ncbi:MAG: hypothetical protein KGQ36_00255 [Rickettsiales bacterium]|nr:hypothetical protein [Rickettsiales bacterium]
MNKDLMNAILAMDAYNRGYVPKINDGSVIGNEIGNAVIGSDSKDLGNNVNGERVDQSSSFYAISYTYGGETIISYRGTDKISDDLTTGWTLGVGVYNSDQAILAARFYQMVLAGDSDPNNDIFDNNVSFTGHSLGGGLAAFMASIYSKEAEVFDHMPYELAADFLEMITNDPSSVLYDATAAYRYYGSQPTREVNNSDVTAYATSGEILYTVREAAEANRLLTELPNPLYKNPLDYTAVDYLNPGEFEGSYDLHSQALLVTLLYAKTEKEAGRLTDDWKNAANSFIDALFEDDVAHSISSSLSADQMLNKIAYSAIDEGTRVFGDVAIKALFNDANDLGKAVGVSNVSSVISSLVGYDIQSAVSKMLVQFAAKLAQDKVLYSSNSQAIEGMLKLSSNSDALTINLSSTIWGTLNPFEKSQMLNDLYNKFGITDASIMPSASDVENIVLSTTNNGSNYNGDLLENISGANLLFGADGIDNISGSISNDIIIGGKGNDELEGGSGTDTYLFNGEYDKDTITDSDGEGVIKINNKSITGTAYLINDGNNNLYQLTIGSEIYLLTKVDNGSSGYDLVIVNNGDSYNEGGSVVNQVTVKDFSSGDLGIVLSDEVDDGSDGSFPIYYVYNGTSGDDKMSSLLSDNAVFYGDAGNDLIFIGNYSVAYAGSGNDTIYARGNDIIYGGSGNDYIISESYDGNVYVFNRGDGNDIIDSYVSHISSNTIYFGDGITKDDVYFVVAPVTSGYFDGYYNLLVKFKDSDTDQLRIKDNFISHRYAIPSTITDMEFSDGSTIDLTSADFVLNINGTDGNDDIVYLYTNNSLFIDAGAGNDQIITGGNKSNIIIAGLGNDYIQSDGSSDDTYVFNKGDGNDAIYDYGGGTDTIKFGEGITLDDIYFTSPSDEYGSRYHAIINFWNSPEDSIQLNWYFDNNGHKIEYLQFSDGSVVSLASLHPENTTYEFSKGQGSYIINDSSGANQIVFGAGITKDDINLVASGNDLLVNFASSPSDQIKITNYSVSNFVNIESLKFSDGSTFSFFDFVVEENGTSGDDALFAERSDIKYVINAGSGNDNLAVGNNSDVVADMGAGDDFVSIDYSYAGSANINGGDGNDTIYGYQSITSVTIDGGNGDDYISGGEANDTLSGGAGNDTIYSNGGNDIIDGGAGVDDIHGEDGNDIINAGSGNDIIYGDAGDDNINGGDGNDAIYGGGGNNILTGGVGSDSFVITSDSQIDTITDFDLVNDKIDVSSLGLNKYFSDLNIYQDGANAVIEVSDKKIILQNINFAALSENNFKGLLKDGGYAISGTNHDDVFYNNYSRSYSLDGALYNDSYVINGYGGDDYIEDSYGDRDILDGGDGNDTLVSRYGGATLIGGAGSDEFVFSYFDNDIFDAITNTITDFDVNDPNEKIVLNGSGISRFSDLEIVDQSSLSLSSTVADAMPFKGNNTLKVAVADSAEGAVITYTTYSYYGYYSVTNTIILEGVLASELSASNFQIGTTINGTSEDEVFDYSDMTNNYYISGYGGNDQVYTGFGDDYVYVSSGDDIVNAGAGNDEIYAWGGNDVVHGGAGDDYISSEYGSSGETAQIYGEEGNDWIYVSETEARQEVSGGGGNDLIDLNASASLVNGDAGDDVINLISGGSNEVNGGDDNDIINIYGGASGNDIRGGSGNDVFVIRADKYNNLLSGNYNYINDFDVNNSNEKIDFQFLNIQFEDLEIYQDGDYAYVDYFLGELGSGSIILKDVDSSQLTANNFIFKNNGTAGDDVIVAANKYNVIDGGNGNDEIVIAAIDGDYNSNSPLESYLTGGAGVDTFIINKTSNSKIEISDFESSVGEKIKLNDFTNVKSFADLYIRYLNNGDSYDASVTLEDGQVLTIKNIENNSLTASDFEFTKSNHAPTVSNPISNQEARVVNFFSFIIPSDAFVDVDGDNLTYDVTLSDGSALPSYLTFDEETRTLSGRIQGYLLGHTISLKVTASDGELSVSQNFDIDVITNIIKGTNADDEIYGTSYDDVIYSYKGEDVIYGDAGSDVVRAGVGNDTMRYDYSDAAVNVNLATNVNVGGYAAGDVLYNIENIYGSAYDDVIVGDGNVNVFHGNGGNDVISGGAGNDEIYGEEGDDVINGNQGEDFIDGGAGDDNLSGGLGKDLIYCGAGNDVVNAGGDDDIVYGEDGNDVIDGVLGNDVLYGGSGDDYLSGGQGNDTIYGGTGDDDIGGGVGDDNLSGGDGNDVMRGAKGDDVIAGGLGADILRGGEGNDIFTFTSLDDSNASAYDIISDFKRGEDLIDLSGLGFASIINGDSSESESILYYYNSGNNTIIEDHNHTFQLTLSGKINFGNSDFDFS